MTTDDQTRNGRILDEDVRQVRERADIEAIVGEYVTLKGAGAGALKGLCPFHDEKSPSFTVRPQAGFYHCFGCQEGGDVISFAQKINNMSFAEAVEFLASRVGITLRYEEGTGGVRRGEDPRRRARLTAAHDAAQEFYAKSLMAPEAVTARRYLAERGFTHAHALQFGIGYAPQGWDNLKSHLMGLGYTDRKSVV